MSRYRHEFKYLIDAKQDSILFVKTAGVLQRDPHVGSDGTYIIRSAYFDDYSDSCLMDNIRGADPRSKFRIRYYNNDDSMIRLEKKSKNRTMTLKESCKITKDECEIFLNGGIPEINAEASDIKKRLFSEVLLRGLKPKVIVTYERAPFVYSGGNVRVTFDRKLSSSNEVEKFLTGDYMTRPILPCGHTVLEVKWDEVMPKHIKEVLRLENLKWTAFSKYYMCRMLHL